MQSGLRQALRANPSKKAPTFTMTIPAPVKGWMARESLAEAEEDSAVVLTNFFPEADVVRARRGSHEHATGLGASVTSLLRYISASTSKLFAAAGDKIFDVTAGDPLGAPALSGMSNAWWQQVMFATAAGQFLVMCNGEDGVWTFDGTTWVDRTAAITTPPGPGSLDASLAVNVTAHKKRLWFVPVASTDLYYLDTEAVEGTAHKFPVGSLLKRGGYIMAMGTYSVDAGEGMDDLFVAISSEGEVIIYSGTDPASATLWQLVGVYHVGDPLGRRSLFQAGGDLMMIIEHGVVPISTALKMDKAVLGEKAATKNIKQAYVDAVARARLAQGWEICSFPLHNMALVNVPGTGSSPIQQFVFNTTTGAWALFEGYNARCWAEYQGHLHFGTDDGRVMHGEHGANDDGAPIILKMLPAFNHLKSPGRIKHVKDYRWHISTDLLDNSFFTAIGADYVVPTQLGQAGEVGLGVGQWFQWDVTPWDGPAVWYGEQVAAHWTGAANTGSCLSPYFQKALDAGPAGGDFRFRIIAADLVYEPGGVL
jgi:roadblock/LC7 domain-containing protein